MKAETIAMIGTRGHYGTVLREMEVMPSLRLVASADGGDSVAPIVGWCRQHGHAPQMFDDYRTMLDRAKPDVLVVCGPFEAHAAMCIDAVERGVHVITEKPAALTLAELEKLSAACERHPNMHVAGMMFSRYDAGFFTAKGLIDSGAVGDVRLINARKSYRLGTRDPHYHRREMYGGTIPWVGSHAIDWAMWMGNQPFTRVYATHSARDNGGNGTMERSALCHFTLAGERFASVSIDVFRPDKAPTHGDDWIRVVGTAGVLEARPESVMLINADNDGSKPVPVGCDRSFLRDFVDHVEGRGRMCIDTRSTLELTRACLLARESADEGRIVEFEEPPSLSPALSPELGRGRTL
ncbi:MAG TPA: Gfo/Idh/MocA family oxidoreductase [Tepidisphaeraceae bacterium]|nr:Gfo/Idh/MocA family oxidoreductase [Tepidisphaeraceae bacterium]